MVAKNINYNINGDGYGNDGWDGESESFVVIKSLKIGDFDIEATDIHDLKKNSESVAMKITQMSLWFGDNVNLDRRTASITGLAYVSDDQWENISSEMGSKRMDVVFSGFNDEQEMQDDGSTWTVLKMKDLTLEISPNDNGYSSISREKHGDHQYSTLHISGPVKERVDDIEYALSSNNNKVALVMNPGKSK